MQTDSFPRLSGLKVAERTDVRVPHMVFDPRSIPAFPTPLRRVIGHHWPWYRLPGPMAFWGLADAVAKSWTPGQPLSSAPSPSRKAGFSLHSTRQRHFAGAKQMRAATAAISRPCHVCEGSPRGLAAMWDQTSFGVVVLAAICQRATCEGGCTTRLLAGLCGAAAFPQRYSRIRRTGSRKMAASARLLPRFRSAR
jgi:hypothetical protein